MSAGSKEKVQVIVSLNNSKAITKGDINLLSKNAKYELPILNGFVCDVNID